MSEHHRTTEWARTVREVRPVLAAALPRPCVDCGQPVLPNQRWQVGHIVPAAIAKAQGWTTAQINHRSNLGPSHTKSRGQKACNQIAGGKLGAAIAKSNRRAEHEEYPAW